MTEIHISAIAPRVGRKLLWPEKMVAPFAKGTLARIDALRTDGEGRTDFIREAVEREIKRRADKPS